MRYTLGVLTICFLAGCSMSPPKPPSVKGEYRPVNAVKNEGKARLQKYASVFDFVYEGDITNALDALRIVQPQLQVLAPLGHVKPLWVRVNLHAVTLEKALGAIGEQGGGIAEVVWNNEKRDNQVYVRFHELVSQTPANTTKK